VFVAVLVLVCLFGQEEGGSNLLTRRLVVVLSVTQISVSFEELVD